MVSDGVQRIAACGLDCGTCEIRLLPTDEAAAAVTVDWYRRQGWLKENEGVAEALARKMYCCGCHGDRSIHWSADCWILHCCVDGHGLAHCSQCAEFPCTRLLEWSQQNEGYAAALRRLRDRAGQP